MGTQDRGRHKGQAGGRARAKALSPEERTEIAQRAATARWNADVPEATHIGELRIGEVLIPCAVLPDGTRVLSQGGITQAFGPVTGGWQKKRADRHMGEVPQFLVADSLKGHIPEAFFGLAQAFAGDLHQA